MQTMAGTLTSEQLLKLQQQQQPLIDALRANGDGAMAFNPSNSQSGGVQGVTNALGMGGNSGLTRGMGIADAMLGVMKSNPVQNVGTAMRYDTNPFSQQTNMLQAQDAAFL